MEELQSLVLNCGFQPVGSISWKKAIVMIMTGKATMVESYDIPIRSQKETIACPSVISISKSIPHKRNMVTFSRNNIFARDKLTCQYCYKRFKKEQLTLDHVVPQCRGGKTNWSNIVTSCLKCNSKKSDKSLIQSGYRLKTQPKKPSSVTWIYKFDEDEIPQGWRKYLQYSGYA